MKKNYLLLALAVSLFLSPLAQQRIEKTVFQAFWWDYKNNNFPNGWANYLTELAPRLKAMGFDAIWIPPSYKNQAVNWVGYGPFDNYDLGDKYQKGGSTVNVRTALGTKDEFLRMIAVMHANGIEVIQDVVLNHNDGAGTTTGAGGQDPASQSQATNGGYKNFRYSSYATPGVDESQNDYFSRSGRWSKNYTNYYPNPDNPAYNTNDINSAYFGPDISYESNAFGPSTNIPTSGTTTIGSITRPFYNPPQSNNYMRTGGRDWLLWLKKQTGVDGWRWDAVKHFPVYVQEDYIYNTKYSLPTFAAGGQDMFCVGEWIGNAGELDAYVNNVKTGSALGVTDEKHTGTFDFSFRGYGPNGGIYSMVLSSGSYDMQNLPGEQQGERYMIYPDGKRVYRTVPFVNSHDTYRPVLDASGNFSQPLGNASGWNTGDELGGNGRHIDPREPRLAAAYAAINAIDGNPVFFFEDIFDIGTTGKRYTHLPGNTTDLPTRSDLQNILQAHQRLGFKDGDYRVLTALTGSDAPYYQKGSSSDHLIIERSGKAIIGISDFYSTVSNNSQDEETYVTADASWVGKQLYDWSGAHGITTTQVYSDRRVLIKTAPVSHTIAGANGHGYSIWAPAPAGVTISSVADLYNYIANYAPARNVQTTQEWEMADDLGDSHCSSLGQGGRLPDNSTNERVAGKIFSATGQAVSVKVYPETDNRDLTASIWTNKGTKVAESTGITTSASPLLLTYTPAADGWLIVKIRNSNASQAGQKCFVNVTYTAPAVVNTRDAAYASDLQAAVWTGNKGTTDVSDCGNWEEGKFPGSAIDVIIPANAYPAPVVTGIMPAKNLYLDNGASLTVNPGSAIAVQGDFINYGGSINGLGRIAMNGSALQQITGATAFPSLEINNTGNVQLNSSIIVNNNLLLTSGKIVLGNNSLSVSPSGTITGGSNTSYIQTLNAAGEGGCLMQTVTNTNVIFPVGNSNYTPVTVANSGVANIFCVSTFEDVLEHGTSGASLTTTQKLKKTWVITPQSTGADAAITLQWETVNEDAGFGRNNAAIAKNTGGAADTWNEIMPRTAASGTGPFSLSASGITGFSEFTVFGNDAILPLKWKSFTLQSNPQQIKLNWQTAEEKGVRIFRIQRSFDGKLFSTIDSVAAGKAGGAYQYSDTWLWSRQYYRLQSIDVDGRFSYSAVLSAISESNMIITPNPTKGMVLLSPGRWSNQKIQVKISSADGRLLQQYSGEVSNVADALKNSLVSKPSGIYIFQVTSNTELKVFKIKKL